MDKEILSLNDVAEYLGLRIGTVHKLIKTKGIPVMRVGRKIIKVRKQDLLEWVERHVVLQIGNKEGEETISQKKKQWLSFTGLDEQL